MKSALIASVIISSLSLIVIILLQNQGSGLGAAFGGGEGGAYRTKRGAEKLLFYLTIVLGVVFVASIIGLLVVG